MNNNHNHLLASKPVAVKAIVLGSSGAGKTSFLRRFFNENFSRERRSTIGSDFYSSIVPNPLYHEPRKKRDIKSSSCLDSQERKAKKKKKSKHRKHKEDESLMNIPKTSLNFYEQEPYVALQMWDTAGKERFVSEATGLTSRLGDSFFRYANVAILCYNGTSSRSFLQLIKWHTELRERMNHVRLTDMENTNNVNSKDNLDTIQLGRPLPVLVVATHVDIILAEESRVTTKRKVEQRGFMPKAFNGMDYHYEYTTVELHADTSKHRTNSSNETKKDTVLPFKDSNLSFGLEATGRWAGDKTYIDHVKLAEDECFPDRNMVKRWCKRNGLGHVEVSSLDGTGIKEAVDTAIRLALMEMNEKKKLEDALRSGAYIDDSDAAQNPSINLHERYKQKQDSCSFCRFLINLFFHIRVN